MVQFLVKHRSGNQDWSLGTDFQLEIKPAKTEEDVMANQPLHYKSITELGAMLRSGETTPTALTEYLLTRINNLNVHLIFH